MNYKEFKDFKQQKFNDFEGIFFAFNNEQFKEGLKKVGLKEGEENQLAKIFGGGFILKNRVADFQKMNTENVKLFKKLMLKDHFLKDAFMYELSNHEYSYTYDDEEALSCFGMTKDKMTERELNILQEAKKEYLSNCEF